jgi:hypothetical protein
MIHVAEEFYFAQCPLRINSIVEGISDLFDRDLLARKRILKCTAKVKDHSVTSSVLQHCHGMHGANKQTISRTNSEYSHLKAQRAILRSATDINLWLNRTSTRCPNSPTLNSYEVFNSQRMLLITYTLYISGFNTTSTTFKGNIK